MVMGTWFIEHDGVGLAVGLDGLKDLFPTSTILWFWFFEPLKTVISRCHDLFMKTTKCSFKYLNNDTVKEG